MLPVVVILSLETQDIVFISSSFEAPVDTHPGLTLCLQK